MLDASRVSTTMTPIMNRPGSALDDRRTDDDELAEQQPAQRLAPRPRVREARQHERQPGVREKQGQRSGRNVTERLQGLGDPERPDKLQVADGNRLDSLGRGLAQPPVDSHARPDQAPQSAGKGDRGEERQQRADEHLAGPAKFDRLVQRESPRASLPSAATSSSVSPASVSTSAGMSAKMSRPATVNANTPPMDAHLDRAGQAVLHELVEPRLHRQRAFGGRPAQKRRPELHDRTVGERQRGRRSGRRVGLCGEGDLRDRQFDACRRRLRRWIGLGQERWAERRAGPPDRRRPGRPARAAFRSDRPKTR